MLGIVYILLAVAAYGAFYLGAPGRQSKAIGSPRALLIAGVVLTAAALVVSIIATQSAVGPVLVLTVMMAVGSVLALVGPFALPETEQTTERASAPRAKAMGGAVPSAGPPGARPIGTHPASPPPARSAKPDGGTAVAGSPPSGALLPKPKLPPQRPPSS